MTRSHRRLHLRMWSVVVPVIGLVLLRALSGGSIP